MDGVHVVPHARRWAVKLDEDGEPESVHETQQEAIDAGRRHAIAMGAELVVHEEDLPVRGGEPLGAATDALEA